MSNQIVESFICPCNANHVYPSKQAFKAHCKSNRHLAFVSTSKDTKADATRRDNKILQLEMNLKFSLIQVERLSAEKAQLINKLSKLPDEDTLHKMLNKFDRLQKRNKILEAMVKKYKQRTDEEFHDTVDES